MWLFKLLFLLALIASWMPVDSEAEIIAQTTLSYDFESEEEEQEEELEEEVVV